MPLLSSFTDEVTFGKIISILVTTCFLVTAVIFGVACNCVLRVRKFGLESSFLRSVSELKNLRFYLMEANLE